MRKILYICRRLEWAYQYTEIPDINTVGPAYSENDFRSAIVIRLNRMNIATRIVYSLGETKIGYLWEYAKRLQGAKFVV
jgi:hypothetical protein